MLYINPSKQLPDEYQHILPIQIDNTLKYFKQEDILLITNFSYKYKDTEAMIVPDSLYCDVHDKASKINIFIYLLEHKILKDFTWFHDLDAFQVHPLDLQLEKDIGFTDYGYSKKWNTGSIFFKPEALDVFKLLRKAIYEHKTDEERALMILTDNNTKKINNRYERLNITYNFGTRHVEEKYKIVDYPIRVLHFHPHKPHHIDWLKDVIPGYLLKMFYQYKAPKPYRSQDLIKALYEKSFGLFKS